MAVLLYFIVIVFPAFRDAIGAQKVNVKNKYQKIIYLPTLIIINNRLRGDGAYCAPTLGIIA